MVLLYRVSKYICTWYIIISQWSSLSFEYDTYTDGYSINRKGTWYYPIQYSYDPYSVSILHNGSDRVSCFKITWENIFSTFGFNISYIGASDSGNKDPWGFTLFSIGH